MRKVRNHNQRSTNPGVMFAAGFESLVNDQLFKPSTLDEEALKVMERKAKKTTEPLNLFSALFRVFFSSKPV